MGMAELYMRVVHHRDADIQAMATVTPDQAVHYQYPPQVGQYRSANTKGGKCSLIKWAVTDLCFVRQNRSVYQQISDIEPLLV